MDKKIKRKWVAALRSGKYKQAREALATDEGYCCLGVLYDIAADGYWVRGAEDGRWYTSIGCEADMLPDEVCLRVGLDTFEHDQLAELNDVDKLSFKQIAQWIVEEIPEDK